MPSNLASAFPAAEPSRAAEHFASRLAFETDCADVYAAMLNGPIDFVLLDVRGPSAYARAHVPGALNMPHREITEERLAAWPKDTLFVVYCAGPHCNGADKGALRLSRLGRRVKLMLGGMTGWADEGFAFARGGEPGSLKGGSSA